MSDPTSSRSSQTHLSPCSRASTIKSREGCARAFRTIARRSSRSALISSVAFITSWHIRQVVGICQPCFWDWRRQGLEGHGSLDSSSTFIPAGSTIEIAATPETCYRLAEWTGDTGGCTINGETIRVPVDGARTMFGHFLALLAPLGTPEWWLALHGWTDDFAVSEISDVDGDGMITTHEWGADTIPTKRDSVLAITGFTLSNGTVTVDWTGGILATQYIHWTGDLGAESRGFESHHLDHLGTPSSQSRATPALKAPVS